MGIALLCLHDTIDSQRHFWRVKGWRGAGAVNRADQGDYEYMMRGRRARVAVVSAALLPLARPVAIARAGTIPGSAGTGRAGLRWPGLIAQAP